MRSPFQTKEDRNRDSKLHACTFEDLSQSKDLVNATPNLVRNRLDALSYTLREHLLISDDKSANAACV